MNKPDPHRLEPPPPSSPGLPRVAPPSPSASPADTSSGQITRTPFNRHGSADDTSSPWAQPATHNPIAVATDLPAAPSTGAVAPRDGGAGSTAPRAAAVPGAKTAPLPPPARGWRRFVPRAITKLLPPPRKSGSAPRTRPSRALCLLIAFFAAALLILLPSKPFQNADSRLLDFRQRWRNSLLPEPISEKIIVVGIDERDHYLGDVKLHSRIAYADLVGELSRYRPAAIVFDILFLHSREYDELFALAIRPPLNTFLAVAFTRSHFERRPQAEMPEDLAPLLLLIEKARTPDETWKYIEMLVEYEEELEQTRTQLRDVPLEDPRQRDLALRTGYTRYLSDLCINRYFVTRFGRPFTASRGPGEGDPFEAQDVLLPSAPLLHNCTGAGFINVSSASEGEDIVRRLPLVHSYRGGLALFPSMSLQVILSYYGATFSDCTIQFGEEISFPMRRNGQGIKRIPIDSRGQYLVNFRQGNDYFLRQELRTLSFYVNPAYQGERDKARLPDVLKDSIILVGETAAGSTDIHPIPLAEAFPLVGVHANVIDNVLKNDFLRPIPAWVEYALLLSMSLVLGFLFSERDPRVAARVAVGLALAYFLLQFLLFLYADNLILPIARIITFILLSAGLLTLYVIGVAERDRRLVKEVFLKSVSPRIGEEILRQFEDPSLWATRRRMTVLFVDIRGFTGMSERLQPEELVELLDEYYDSLSEAVFGQDGQVNKFVGDAVLALFGALPGEPANHAERAVKCGVDIHRAIEALNARREVAGLPERVRVGVGINTGEVVCGTVGRRKIRIEYTALGDAVNTAARLQGQASSGKIYIGGEVLRELLSTKSDLVAGNYAARFNPVEGLTLKGKSQRVEVYEYLYDGPGTGASALPSPQAPPSVADQPSGSSITGPGLREEPTRAPGL